MLYSFKW